MAVFKNFFKKQTAIQILNENSHKSINSAIFNDDVRKAFRDFVKLNKVKDVMVVGGLAVGVYSTARNTQDVDVIVLSEKTIDEIYESVKDKFKKTRPHSLEHRSLGVEIEILTPEFINYSKDVVEAALKNAEIHEVDGREIKVVSAKYLIVLKLKRAAANITKSHMDKFDITNISEIYGKFDLSDLDLPENELKLYDELTKELN